MALKPENPVVGGTVLRRQAVESPNYVPGVSGWAIKQDGSAEFNNMVVRGTFNGTNYTINSAGEFFYSAAPAAGNLVESVTNAAGTDPFGNIYLNGHAAYGAGFATSMQAGELGFYLGSLAAGWTFQGDLLISLIDGHLIVNFTNFEVAGSLTVDSNLTVTGTLTVGGSTSTGTPSNNNTSQNGLTDGTINGTSGAASAGTAHTHPPGSFAVTNGQHTHNLNSHTHPL